jgi:hypothetical protein
MIMANSSGLQYTFYFPTTKDKARWKRLSRGYTLNHWIYMQVERAISSDVRDTTVTNSANQEDADIIKHLRTQNELLTARLQQALSELETLRNGMQTTFDTNVVDILKSGGVWTSEKLLEKLALSAFTANIENLIENKPPINTVLDTKPIEKTLETLQDFHLVENTWRGFKWIG